MDLACSLVWISEGSMDLEMRSVLWITRDPLCDRNPVEFYPTRTAHRAFPSSENCMWTLLRPATGIATVPFS